MENSKDKQTEYLAIQIVSKLFLLMILVGLLASSWWFVSWLNKPENFQFKKVELINQLENQKREELLTTTSNSLNGGFFSLNVDKLRAELLDNLPWVKSVSVRKVWPDRLMIEIVEHKPVARWLSIEKNNTPEEIHLLSQQGVIFSPILTKQQKKKFKKMTLLTGTSTSAEKVLTNCVEMKKKIAPLGLGFKQCGMNERQSWTIKLSLENDFDLKLGKEQVMEHLERFVGVFNGHLKHYISLIESADLRYSNGFSIKWKSVDSLNSQLTTSSVASLKISLQNRAQKKAAKGNK